jgi:beta-glucanase (GH16 family)
MGPNPEGAHMPFASGELQSRDVYQYGYYEVRMRVPRGSGTGVGFFTYTEPNGPRTWQEIDIEFIGRDTTGVELTYHLNGRHSGQRLRLPFDAADEYHTYGFEWTPQGIRWYVDNRLAREAINEGAEGMNRPQRLYLSLWSTTLHQWAGRLDRSGAPWTLYVSCVAQAREYRGESLCTS